MESMTLLLLQTAGALLLLWGLARLAHWLWLYVWLPQRLSGKQLAQRYGAGSLALITGAGDGLGRAFARELARSGFHLILASRTRSKLEQLQAELQASGVQVRIVAVDLSDPTPAASEALAQAASVSTGYISQIERGTRQPSRKALTAFAAALGLDPEDLA